MTDQHKRYAVVIGVSTYEDDIADLPCAKNDAYRLQSVLQQRSGFAADRVYFLANGFDPTSGVVTLPPTRANVLQKLKYVCDAAGPEDFVMLYFAGHGAEISKTPYLITADTRMDVLSQTALNVDELNEMLESASTKCVLRVFDACRAPFAQGRGVAGRMTDGLQQAVMKCAKGWASFSSCSSGEVAHESGELNHGVFTYYLCEGLAGKARNESGNITIEGLVDYVKTSVGNWCDRQTLRQTPHFQSDLSGLLVMGTALASPPEKPTPPGSPFGELVAGVDLHLSQTAADTRRLTFTSKEEWEGISGALIKALQIKLAELSHPAIKAELGKMQPLQNHGNPPWHEFNSDLATCAVQKEFTNETAASRVEFISSEVVVPKTTLHVAVVRFNFFYWLWYCHVCHPEQLQGMFKPDPAYAKGFFTFKPSGAKDGEKMERAVTELLSRSSREILSWAKQLGAYVESRVDPLRKVGPIID